ncbi:MAG: homocysteine S-methyltransferase family protein [Elusimicrobiota bacterium]|jgi:5-methyltetrahydrofolate--homocysteine methyltransferase|nr:homocysteine S-methyltransferase family protein [Elusimicrobiota bacterium]
MDKKEFLNLLSQKVLIADGAYATELQRKNYLIDIKTPEEINIKYPQRICDIYCSYIDAGSDIILANTFGANPINLLRFGLENKIEPIICVAISLARKCIGKRNIIVAGDISSLPKSFGRLAFKDSYNAFCAQAKLLEKFKADIIIIETITDLKELKAALIAACENFSGAILVSMAFAKKGGMLDLKVMKNYIALSESLGACAIGFNCSFSPADLCDHVKILAQNTSLPILFKPNAGLPVLIDQKLVFPVSIAEFVEESLRAYSYGANIFGGCCGTRPEYIKAIAGKLKNKKALSRKN